MKSETTTETGMPTSVVNNGQSDFDWPLFINDQMITFWKIAGIVMAHPSLFLHGN
jgi:hypothetical protein